MKIFSPGTLVFISIIMLILPGCKNQPYDQFKKQRKEKSFREKQALMHTIKKRKLTKHMKDMTLDEALEAKMYYEELGRDDMIMILIPRIIALSQDVNLVAELNLELANLHLAFGEIDEAHKMYSNFVLFYPGNKYIKVARYRQLLTLFWGALDPDRDQSITIMAIDQAKNYLKDFPDDVEYVEKVHDILKACYQKMLEGELGLVRFYLNKFQYEKKATAVEAARLRLEDIKEKIVPILGMYDQRAKVLARDMAPIESIESTDVDIVLPQIKLIEDQVNQIAVLLQLPDQKHVVHPRDTF